MNAYHEITNVKSLTRNLTSSLRRKYLLKRIKERKPTSPMLVKQRMFKKYILAKKYHDLSAEGKPLPGTIEDDFVKTPEKFFDSSVNKSPIQKRCYRQLAVCKDLHHNNTQQEELSLPDVFKVNYTSSFRKAIQSKADIISDRKNKALSYIPMTDTEIDNRYKEVFDHANRIRRSSSFKTQQEQILETYRKAKTNWERQLKSISKKLNRLINNTVVSRADHFRERVEELSALEQVTLSEAKYGSRNWKLSLRNNEVTEGTRPLCFRAGKASDGPCHYLIDNPKRVKEIVRNPGLIRGNYKTFINSSSFKEKIEKEAKRIRELIPLTNIIDLQIIGVKAMKVEYEGFKECKLPKVVIVECRIESEII